MTATQSEQLPYLSTEERLKAYQMIIDGCSHIWSKGKIQEERAQRALDTLIPLTKSDPFFLAHLTSYVMTRMEKAKDLQVFVTYANALNSADGTPFSEGSSYKKPDLRYVSAAALHLMDAKLANMLVQVAKYEYGVDSVLNQGQHFPNALKTAFKKYLKYREANPGFLKGIRKAGLSNKYTNIYRKVQVSPSDEAASILGWQQKDHKVELQNSLTKEFETLTDLQIAEKIRSEKLPVLGALTALPRKMSPVIAVALLEQSTGNQAVILRRLFEEQGVLTDPEVLSLYEEKIKTAQTALDRAETLSKDASEAVKKVLSSARSEVRKQATAGIGKVYMHIDFSGSMNDAIEFAKERGAVIAECVNNPEENFRWGLFGTRGLELPLPQTFEKDAFHAALFGAVPNGSTDVFALYPNAREFGAEVDVIVTDQGHNVGDLADKIRRYHQAHPEVAKPKVCVIVNFGPRGYDLVQRSYEANDIPVAVMRPEALTESALVVEAVKQALVGPMVIIDEIMSTELLKLPEYYFTV